MVETGMGIWPTMRSIDSPMAIKLEGTEVLCRLYRYPISQKNPLME